MIIVARQRRSEGQKRKDQVRSLTWPLLYREQLRKKHRMISCLVRQHDIALLVQVRWRLASMITIRMLWCSRKHVICHILIARRNIYNLYSTCRNRSYAAIGFILLYILRSSSARRFPSNFGRLRCIPVDSCDVWLVLQCFICWLLRNSIQAISDAETVQVLLSLTLRPSFWKITAACGTDHPDCSSYCKYFSGNFLQAIRHISPLAYGFVRSR